MITKRKSLIAALAFALPIAALVASPAMAAKPQKAKSHHVVKKAAAHKVGVHKAAKPKIKASATH